MKEGRGSTSRRNVKISYEEFDDNSLWKAISSDGLEPLSCAYKRFYNGLYYYGLKITYKTDLIEDCIQDVFLKLWDKRFTIKIEVAFKPYLFRMFRRTVIDKLAQLNKFDESEISNNFLNLALSAEDLIIKTEIESENLQLLGNALKKLSPKSKEVIYLRFYEDMSYQEIADTLHIKYQSVRNSVYESLKLLKSVIKLILIIFITTIPWF